MPVYITLGMNSTSGVSAVIIIVLLSMAILHHTARCVAIANVRPIMLAGAFASLLVLAFLISYNNQLIKDELTWHTRALTVTSYLNGSSNTPIADFGGKDGYVWFVGTIYALVGVVPLVPIALNFLFQALIVITVARTTELITLSFSDMNLAARKRAVMVSASVAALAPSLLPWVPHLLREIGSSFLISLAVLMCVQFVRTKQPRFAISAIAAVLILFAVRDSIGLGMSMALVAAVAFIWIQNPKYQVAMRLFLLVPFVVGAAVFWNFANERFGLSAEDLTTHSQSLSDGATSGFFSDPDGAAGYGAILSTNVPRAVFGPFPWDFQPNGVMIFAFMEGIVWILAIVFAIRARPLKVFRRTHDQMSIDADDGRVLVILLAAAFALLAMVAISTGHYGILSRLRTMPLVAILPLSAVGFAKWRIGRVGGHEKLPIGGHGIAH